MSDTTVGHSPRLVDRVAAYVREVRAELADLPTEDVDDLTSGMEADLSELSAESGGDLVGRLGSPRLYAAELRSAAGLPERAAGSARRRPLNKALRHAGDSLTIFTEQRPWLASVTAYLVTLRPAWWLVRGYLAAWALLLPAGGMGGVRPHGALELATALGAIVVSVQLGRGWLRQWAGLRPLLVVANTVAGVLALVALTWGLTSGAVSYAAQAYGPQPGVAFDGAQVANIYAYGSDGKRITGVRLFAEDGRPLNGAQTSVDAGGRSVGTDANGNPIAAVRDSSGAPVLNAYPLMLFGPDPWRVTDPANPAASSPQWTPPLSINPLLPSSTAIPAPTPTAPTTTTSPTTPTTPTSPATPRTPTTGTPAKPAPPKPASPTASSGRVRQ